MNAGIVPPRGKWRKITSFRAASAALRICASRPIHCLTFEWRRRHTRLSPLGDCVKPSVVLALLLTGMLVVRSPAQSTKSKTDRVHDGPWPTGTFSILAFDPATGEL